MKNLDNISLARIISLSETSETVKTFYTMYTDKDIGYEFMIAAIQIHLLREK